MGVQDSLLVTRKGIDKMQRFGMRYNTIKVDSNAAGWGSPPGASYDDSHFKENCQQLKHFTAPQVVVLGVDRFVIDLGFGLFERYKVSNEAVFEQLPEIDREKF